MIYMVKKLKIYSTIFKHITHSQLVYLLHDIQFCENVKQFGDNRIEANYA